MTHNIYDLFGGDYKEKHYFCKYDISIDNTIFLHDAADDCYL